MEKLKLSICYLRTSGEFFNSDHHFIIRIRITTLLELSNKESCQIVVCRVVANSYSPPPPPTLDFEGYQSNYYNLFIKIQISYHIKLFQNNR